MNRHFFFRRMRSRIERFVKSCDTCQKCKFPNRALSGEMHPIIAEKIELLFNVTPHISTGYSPYEIISGKNPSNPLSDLADTILPANPPKAVYEIRADVRARLRQAAEQRKKRKKSEETSSTWMISFSFEKTPFPMPPTRSSPSFARCIRPICG
jgi:hypothetical protein